MAKKAENYESQLSLADSTLLKTDAYIGGEWREAADNSRFDVTNPATGAVIMTLPDMGVTESREAIEAVGRKNSIGTMIRQKSDATHSTNAAMLCKSK